MEFEEFYVINRFILSCVGQWPYQDNERRKNLTMLMSFILMSIWPAKFTKLFQSLDDYDMMIECLTPLLSHAILLTQLYNCAFNATKIKWLYDDMKSDWSNVVDRDDREILLEYAEKGRWAAKAYAIYIYMTTVVYCMIPLSPQIMDIIKPLNESRPLMYLFPVEYHVDHEKYYYWIWLHAVMIAVFGISFFVGADTQYMVLVMHACGKFAIVGNHVKHITDMAEKMKKDRGLLNKDKYIHALCKCIAAHNKAIKFANLVESSHTLANFVVVSLNLALMSTSEVQVVNNLGDPEMIVRYGLFTFAQVIHLFCLSMPGQKLTDHSLAIQYSINQCNWYEISTKAQKMFIIVLMRSARSLNVTVGKLYILNMENFLTIIKTSVSYFTVLSSV